MEPPKAVDRREYLPDKYPIREWQDRVRAGESLLLEEGKHFRCKKLSAQQIIWRHLREAGIDDVACSQIPEGLLLTNRWEVD